MYERKEMAKIFPANPTVTSNIPSNIAILNHRVQFSLFFFLLVLKLLTFCILDRVTSTTLVRLFTRIDPTGPIITKKLIWTESFYITNRVCPLENNSFRDIDGRLKNTVLRLTCQRVSFLYLKFILESTS